MGRKGAPSAMVKFAKLAESLGWSVALRAGSVEFEADTLTGVWEAECTGWMHDKLNGGMGLVVLSLIWTQAEGTRRWTFDQQRSGVELGGHVYTGYVTLPDYERAARQAHVTAAPDAVRPESAPAPAGVSDPGNVDGWEGEGGALAVNVDADTAETETAEERDPTTPGDMVACFLVSSGHASTRARVLWWLPRRDAAAVCSDERTHGTRWGLHWTADPGERGTDWDFVADDGRFAEVLAGVHAQPVTAEGYEERKPGTCSPDGWCRHAWPCGRDLEQWEAKQPKSRAELRREAQAEARAAKAAAVEPAPETAAEEKAAEVCETCGRERHPETTLYREACRPQHWNCSRANTGHGAIIETGVQEEEAAQADPGAAKTATVEAAAETATEETADIVIRHTHEDGTIIEGSSKGDGVWEALKPLGWTYRRTPGIFIRGSRYKSADRWKIGRAVAAVRALGWSCVEVIEETMSFEEREAARVGAAEERAERFEERAGRAAGAAQAARDASDKISERFWMGQPILVGHHSEEGARRDQERMHNQMRKSIAEGKRAGYWANRAAAAAAYERYRKNPGRTLRRIETLEAERRRVLRERDGVDDRGRKADVWRKEPSEARRAELDHLVAEYDEELTYWAEVIKEAERRGFKVWGKSDFVKGDYARYRGTWYEVTRVNAQSVTIPHILAEFDGGAVGSVGGCRVVTRAAAQAAGRMGVHTYTAKYSDGVTGRMSAEQMRAALAGEPIPVDPRDVQPDADTTEVRGEDSPAGAERTSALADTVSDPGGVDGWEGEGGAVPGVPAPAAPAALGATLAQAEREGADQEQEAADAEARVYAAGHPAYMECCRVQAVLHQFAEEHTDMDDAAEWAFDAMLRAQECAHALMEGDRARAEELAREAKGERVAFTLGRLEDSGAIGPHGEGVALLDEATRDLLTWYAAPYPVRWLFRADRPRILHICHGPGGWSVGIRDVLGADADMVGIDLDGGAVATARAAGFYMVHGDVTALDPEHPALREVTGVVLSPPCQPYSPGGLRKGRYAAAIALICDVIRGVGAAAGFLAVHGAPTGYAPRSGDTWEEVRAPLTALDDERAGLMAEVAIWPLAMLCRGGALQWVAVEQSSALPQQIEEALFTEFRQAGWGQTLSEVLEAADHGAPTRRKRRFMTMHRSAAPLPAAEPANPLPVVTFAEALGWDKGHRVKTRGNRRIDPATGRPKGGGDFNADTPGICVTATAYGWQREADGLKLTQPEIGRLVGFDAAYPWTHVGRGRGVRHLAQQAADVVCPMVAARVIGRVLGVDWEAPTRAYVARLYRPAATTAPTRAALPAAPVRPALAPAPAPAPVAVPYQPPARTIAPPYIAPDREQLVEAARVWQMPQPFGRPKHPVQRLAGLYGPALLALLVLAVLGAPVAGAVSGAVLAGMAWIGRRAAQGGAALATSAEQPETGRHGYALIT
ncbi:DUF3560 domain-containing protein [Streptomyces palmae]|uniref:DUF3560 domain-containing protein n=1 Tax=Streptomyces palmae TaxID=1701085 RepID=A0A4Z0GVL2_9ACTN|nr:DUF3560 domain-containing protein [Streptomyces palmae]TGB01816.1 DUF3560 domain-containing protein [Streptomyces palmae]